MLVRVGSFTLGDRDGGEVRLDGATLFVGRSKTREKNRERDTTITLE